MTPEQFRRKAYDTHDLMPWTLHLVKLLKGTGHYWCDAYKVKHHDLRGINSIIKDLVAKGEEQNALELYLYTCCDFGRCGWATVRRHI